ncbi:MAG: TolC family protein [Azonexus sp.]|nr:TolC family protein [Azonexus sp.]
MKQTLWPLLLLCAAPVLADTLPPPALAAQALLGQPEVLAAAHRINAEHARRQQLAAGEHEWTVRAGTQRRRVTPDNTPASGYSEWNLALERPWRLPGKARTDNALGDSGVSLAETTRGDTLHEAGRLLLKRWFEQLREVTREQQWAAQRELLTEAAKAISRREQLGDAPRIERILAEAAVAQADAQWQLAHQRATDASDSLKRYYPALGDSQPTLPTSLPPLAGDEASWIAAILEHNHELTLARGETAHARLQATRQQQDRLPDPSIGIQWSRERGGEENVVGAYLSVQIPGGARRAMSDTALALAAAAASQESAVERRVTAEAAASYRAAIHGRQAWEATRQAAAQTQEAARLSTRAYQLGEGSLGDVLQARRQANEASLAAQQAQIDALEAHYRLLLDTHQLWDLD